MFRASLFASATILACLFLPQHALGAQLGVLVGDEARIAAASGGFGGELDPVDRFGEGLCGLGDVDGDEIPDLAIGAPSDDGSGSNQGAIHIVLLRADGSAKASLEIGAGRGGFPFALDDGACFGGSLAALGDLDGDGIPDLAVGARDQDGLGSSRGMVFVLFLQSDGSVRSAVAIGEGLGGFAGSLEDFDNFGHGLATLGDLDGDGVVELVCGATGDDDAGGNAGALYVLFLDNTGAVKSQSKISSGSAGFVGPVSPGSSFGEGLAGTGDLDGDGLPDLAVGAWGDDDAGSSSGAIWTLLLNVDGSVRGEQKITEGQGNFDGDLRSNDAFGISLASLGDLDGNGVCDLVVGAKGDDDGGSRRGAVWVLFLEQGGTLKFQNKISSEEGNFEGPLNNADGFGWGIALVGDLTGSGTQVLAVGAPEDDEGGFDTGAVWLLSLFTGPDFPLGDTAGASPQIAAAGLQLRNGSGVNPVIYTSTELPLIGQDWNATVDTSTLGSAGVTQAIFFAAGLPGVPTSFGELLVDPTGGALASTTVFSFGTAIHTLPIPADPSISGTLLASQVITFFGTTQTLTNALDLTLGF